jgi:sugar phosphate isomerase/epimerase
VPIIRICVNIGREGYLATEARLQREYDALVPVLAKHGVAVGIQNHCGNYIANAMGLRSLIGRYDPAQFCAVWDAAHNALNGEEMEDGLDIVWSHLRMVNLKNAYWKRTTGPEAEHAKWQPYWTLGRHGLASWPRVAAELKRRAWSGPICLPAEYTDEPAVERLIPEDLAFAKSLLS